MKRYAGMEARTAAVLTFLMSIALLAVPAASAAPTWLPPGPPISPAGSSAAFGDIAMDQDGDVLAAWHRDDNLEVAFRPAGGQFGPVATLTSGGLPFPHVAIDPAGGALLVWDQTFSGGRRVMTSYRSPTGAFGPITQVSAAGASNPELAVDRSGNAIAAWDAVDGLGVAYRPAGGEFGPAQVLGAADSGSNGLDIAFDRDGNAIVAAARLAPPGSTSYIEAVHRPAGGSFGALQPIASALDGAAQPSVAFDAAGNALVVFMLWDPTVVEPQIFRWRIGAAVRPAGGDFGPSAPIATVNRFGWMPEVAFDPDGNAIAVWTQGFQPQAAIRPPGGTFGPQQRLSPAAHDTTFGPELWIAPSGTTHITWTGTDGSGYAARAVTRPAGGTYSGMQTLSGTGATDETLIHGDAQGNAVAFWRRSDGSHNRYEIAGLDDAPPRLAPVSIPAAGTAGSPLPFSVSPIDVWSPVTTNWAFGDGLTAAGPQVTHTYSHAGLFAATVTATDALGNSTAASGAVSVAPAPPSPPAAAPAPRLTGLRIAPSRFRAATRGAALTAATRVGTRVRFRLDRSATLRVSAERAASGRRAGTRCVKPTAKNRRARRCTRYVALKGSSSRSARAGQNEIGFSGRLGGRRLAAGRYRLVATAAVAGGTRSTAGRAAFQIARR